MTDHGCSSAPQLQGCGASTRPHLGRRFSPPRLREDRFESQSAGSAPRDERRESLRRLPRHGQRSEGAGSRVWLPLPRSRTEESCQAPKPILRIGAYCSLSYRGSQLGDPIERRPRRLPRTHLARQYGSRELSRCFRWASTKTARDGSSSNFIRPLQGWSDFDFRCIIPPKCTEQHPFPCF